MAKIVQLDTRAIIGGVVTTLVVGGVVGAVGYSRVIELDSYRITTNALAIEELKDSKVDKNVYAANLETLGDKIDTLAEKIEDLKKTIEKRR